MIQALALDYLLRKPWIPVQSTNLAAVGYSPISFTLGVRFTNGRAYAYSDVPPTVFAALLAADSKGRYFQNNIRDAYPFEKIA